MKFVDCNTLYLQAPLKRVIYVYKEALISLAILHILPRIPEDLRHP